MMKKNPDKHRSGRIHVVIMGGWNPYKAWTGVVFSDVWKEVLYHHSTMER
jgi:hypothetical protein